MKPRNKKKIHFESDSSSDSDELIPLNKLRPPPVENVMNSLFKYSVEKCEFCDKIFNNKYNMLVHNAKHIIIPLLNQKVHKCSQCQRLFNSIESLEWHSMKSHCYISENKDYLPKILQSFVKKEPKMVLTKEPLLSNGIAVKNPQTTNNGLNAVEKSCEKDSKMHDNVPEILKSMILRQPVTVLTKLEEPIITNNGIKQNFVSKEPVVSLKNELIISDDEVDINVTNNHEVDNHELDINNCDNDDEDNDKIIISDSDDDDGDSGSPDFNIKTEIDFEYINVDDDCDNFKNSSIKDRIQFEDDDVEIDISVFKSLERDMKKVNNLRKNAIILGNKPNVPESHESVPIDGIRSIHNDELKKPGLYKCKKCSKMFPNRFELIVHEKSHMHFRRPYPFICRICDWYVATSPRALQKHKKVKHPDNYEHVPKTPLRKCPDCNLSFSRILRHRQNYHHEFKCAYCGEMFDTREERSKHKIIHTARPRELAEQKVGDTNVTWLISTVKVCEFCYQWFREKINLKYQFVKTYCKMGERVNCERCERPVFELKVVRMQTRRKYRHGETVWGEKKAKKAMSNAERLKNVQQRLKRLKNLNKY